jgi:hypothetical protein
MNDTTVSVVMVMIFFCHLATIIIGYKIKKIILSISYLNMIFVIGLLIMGANDILNIKQHQFQFRELFVLSIEFCILIFAIYSIIGFHNKTYVKVINHIGFWLHILATTGMLIFMFSFKLDHLF